MKTGNLGIGVMLSMLGGNEDSVAAFMAAVGKPIAAVTLEKNDPDALRVRFEDGSAIEFYDSGQSCCENRYMVVDSALPEFIGAKLVSAQCLEAPSLPDECGDHEVEFLHIQTDKGVITARNHNEHNGYYGGFSVCVREVKP